MTIATQTTWCDPDFSLNILYSTKALTNRARLYAKVSASLQDSERVMIIACFILHTTVVKRATWNATHWIVAIYVDLCYITMIGSSRVYGKKFPVMTFYIISLRIQHLCHISYAG